MNKGQPLTECSLAERSVAVPILLKTWADLVGGHGERIVYRLFFVRGTGTCKAEPRVQDLEFIGPIL